VFELPVFGLRLVGGGPEEGAEGGGGARQGAKISKKGAQIKGNMCLFEETQSGSNRDLVGTQSGTNFRVFGTTFGPVGKMANQKRAKTIKNTAKSCFL